MRCKRKGYFSFFAVALILLSAYYLSFSFVTWRVDNKANNYAEVEVQNVDGFAEMTPPEAEDAKKGIKRAFLDSMYPEVVHNILIDKTTYRESLNKAINLGLDLKGGMNLVLEVSAEDVIRSEGLNNPDESFQAALTSATERATREDKDYTTVFIEEYEKLSPDQQLASIFKANPYYEDKIDWEDDNDKIRGVLQDEVDKSIESTYNVLRTRIDNFGVVQPNISQQDNGRIIIELPGVDDPSRVRKILESTAKLEFWHTYSNQEAYPMLVQINDILKGILDEDDLAEADSAEVEDDVAVEDYIDPVYRDSMLTVYNGDTALVDSLLASSAAAEADSAGFDPLFRYLYPAVYQDDNGNYQFQEGSAVGYVNGNDTGDANQRIPEFRSG